MRLFFLLTLTASPSTNPQQHRSANIESARLGHELGYHDMNANLSQRLGRELVAIQNPE